MIEIRSAKYSDVPAVAGMCEAFFKESQWAQFGLGHNLDDTLLWLRGILDAPNMDMVVAQNAVPVGFAVVGFKPWVLKADDLIGFELLLYLKPEYRRGNTGKKLLERLETIAKERGAKTMECGSATTIAKGRVSKLFERQGYMSSINGYMKAIGG